MSSYNTQLQSNNTGLQTILNTINNLPLNDYSENEDALLDGTLGVYINDKVTNIGKYAFYAYSNLTTASFPACTNIDNYAFDLCSNLTTVSFPVCTSMGANAFHYCSNLTTVSFPVCTSMGANAFTCCGRLTEAAFPVCTTIGGGMAFYACYRLTTVDFHMCTSIPANTFEACYELASINLSMCTSIGAEAFSKCYRFSSITLGASSVCILTNSNAFSSTPFAGYNVYFRGTPYIYVPSSLITAYQSATNWVYYSSYFSSIESLEKELITFTILGEEYQAVEGMTWGEWVESEYNTSNYFVDGEYVYGGIINGMPYQDVLYEYAGSRVTINDTIVAEHNYFISGMIPL